MYSLSPISPSFSFFFFNDTATTEIYTLSLHDALPISRDSIVTRFRNGESLPGFSLPKNKNWDPRAEAMMRALEASLGDDAEFKRLRRATDTALDIAGLRPDFILPATFVGRRLGLKGQELIVASLGRIASWFRFKQWAAPIEQTHVVNDRIRHLRRVLRNGNGGAGRSRGADNGRR